MLDLGIFWRTSELDKDWPYVVFAASVLLYVLFTFDTAFAVRRRDR